MPNKKTSADTCLERCIFVFNSLPDYSARGGMTAREIFELLHHQGYDVTLRTVQRYINKLLLAGAITYGDDEDIRAPRYCRDIQLH